MEQVTFKGRTYRVEKELPVSPVIKANGVIQQLCIVGAKGATGLMQTFANSRRVIWFTSASTRTETEFTAAQSA